MTLFYLCALLLTLACAAFMLRPVYASADLSPRLRKVIMAWVLCITVGGTMVIYSMTGAPRLLELLDERSVMRAEALAEATKIQNEIKNSPKNPELWMRLGLAQMQLDDLEAAMEAFRQAVVHSRGKPQALLLLAKGHIAYGGGTVTTEAKRALEMVLLQQPQNLEARYLTALYFSQQKQKEQAVSVLDALLNELPKGIPFRAKVQSLRDEVE